MNKQMNKQMKKEQLLTDKYVALEIIGKGDKTRIVPATNELMAVDARLKMTTCAR